MVTTKEFLKGGIKETGRQIKTAFESPKTESFFSKLKQAGLNAQANDFGSSFGTGGMSAKQPFTFPDSTLTNFPSAEFPAAKVVREVKTEQKDLKRVDARLMKDLAADHPVNGRTVNIYIDNRQ